MTILTDHWHLIAIALAVEWTLQLGLFAWLTVRRRR